MSRVSRRRQKQVMEEQRVEKEEEEVELSCIIHNARPRPDIIWYLGDQEFVRGKSGGNNPGGSRYSGLSCHFNNFSLRFARQLLTFL